MKLVFNSKYQKLANKILILNYLRNHKDCSRIAIARDLGLQPSTVTYITASLISQGLVCETFEMEKQGSGRKPIRLKINEKYGCILGIDLQADYYQYTISDITGYVLCSSKEFYSHPPANFSNLVTSVLDKIIKSTNQDEEGKIMGACLALPGIVNSEKSTVIDCWTHSLKNYRLDEELLGVYPFTIMLENDANCCAWKQLWDNGNNSGDCFIYLLPRFHRKELVPEGLPPVGIGVGIVIEGKVFGGYRSMAGEFRSIFYEEKGLGQLSLTIEELGKVPADRKILERLIIEVLKNIFFLVPTLNPRKIYVGGDFSQQKSFINTIMKKDLKIEVNFLQTMQCEFEVLTENSNDVSEGAAFNVHRELFTIPKVGVIKKNSFWLDLIEEKEKL